MARARARRGAARSGAGRRVRARSGARGLTVKMGPPLLTTTVHLPTLAVADFQFSSYGRTQTLASSGDQADRPGKISGPFVPPQLPPTRPVGGTLAPEDSATLHGKILTHRLPKAATCLGEWGGEVWGSGPCIGGARRNTRSFGQCSALALWDSACCGSRPSSLAGSLQATLGPRLGVRRMSIEGGRLWRGWGCRSCRIRSQPLVHSMSGASILSSRRIRAHGVV